jgi:hypothetical protein
VTRYRISGSTIAALGLAVFFLAPYQVQSFDSSVFPRIISILLVLFGILVILAPAEVEKQTTIKMFDPLLSAYFVLVFATIVLIRYFGFYPSIFLALPCCLILFRQKNYKRIILFTIITIGMIYLFIDVILGSRLP